MNDRNGSGPTIKQVDSMHLKISFSESLVHVPGWIRKADELLVAAEILEEQVVRMWEACDKRIRGEQVDLESIPDVHDQYFLLIAYALENLFKAVLIRKRGHELKNKLLNNLPGYLRTHKLVDLAGDVGFSLKKYEEDLLRRLTRESLWASRYPVPVNADGINTVETFSDGNTYLIAYFTPGDVPTAKNLIERLRKEESL